MKCCTWTLILALLATVSLGAQTLDLAAGAGTVAGGVNLHSGFWPSFSGTGWFGRWLGANGEFSLRTRGPMPGLAPWLADFNLAVRPVDRSVTPVILLGVGIVHSPVVCNCPTPFGAGPAYMSETDATYHFGFALKHYVHKHWFLRFAYSLYATHLAVGHPQRFSIMLGYTFGHR